jgi:hypothetical protein
LIAWVWTIFDPTLKTNFDRLGDGPALIAWAMDQL